MSMATLVAMVNELGGAVTMKTFSQRSKAVERLNKLAYGKGVQLDQYFNEDGSKRVIEAEEPKQAVRTEVTGTTVDLQLSTVTDKPKDDEPKGDAPMLETDPNWPFKQHESQLKAAEEAEQAKPVEKPKAPKKEPRVSIRVVAEAKLMEVVSIDEGGRKVGLSYAEILDYLHANFQGSKTTVACLRWYAAHMRDRGTLPPNRPRAVPKKAEPQVAEPANDSQTSEAA
jgi:hypothetical protein